MQGTEADNAQWVHGHNHYNANMTAMSTPLVNMVMMPIGTASY
jgi:hypothetical protein